MRRRVIKLGGSLLPWDGLQAALTQWFSRQPAAIDVLIIGGGSLVDAIRDLDQCHRLDEIAAHWLAVRAMGVSAQLAAAIWPEFVLISEWEELLRAMEAPGAGIVFDAEEFLRRHEPSSPGVKLPQAWSVTSDSIAARLAECLNADELVLLKSALPFRSPASLAEAAGSGYVDSFFPRAAAVVSEVRAVNLRSLDFDERPLGRFRH